MERFERPAKFAWSKSPDVGRSLPSVEMTGVSVEMTGVLERIRG